MNQSSTPPSGSPIRIDAGGVAVSTGGLDVRMVATGLLILMALLFIGTTPFIADMPWLAFVRAFAEAGLVGGLADCQAADLVVQPERPGTAHRRHVEDVVRLPVFVDAAFLDPRGDQRLGRTGAQAPLRQDISGPDPGRQRRSAQPLTRCRPAGAGIPRR